MRHPAVAGHASRRAARSSVVQRDAAPTAACRAQHPGGSNIRFAFRVRFAYPVPNPRRHTERTTVGKGTIKVKKKCCRSRPPCKSCPIVVLRDLLREAKAQEVKKAQKKARKEAKKKKSAT
ncbi:hypothetical protein GCM10011581_04460 [Saccharopolyspora subtropica]|uniref:Uncharacterized protein n=1 Tax=Saccharopolyspora thermophila TaxID=89367 RepID=A0A917JJA1_9PSEU|nr:hypothetical protein GCM10011581_04460 [Saccharopolyspora subtropica]